MASRIREAAFFDEMRKLAARAGLKLIRKALAAGDVARAARLAKTPGVIKSSIGGSQIRILGGGGEGVATLVAHPQYGLAVRKLFDPSGLSGPEMVARKALVGRAVKSPYVAKHLGEAVAPGGAPIHFTEYVHSGAGPRLSPKEMRRAIRHAEIQAQRALHGASGYMPRDVRSGNMIWSETEGRYKLVDYLPFRRGEVIRAPKRAPKNVIRVTPEGYSALGPLEKPKAPVELIREQFGRPMRSVAPRVTGPATTAPTILQLPKRIIKAPAAPSSMSTAPTILQLPRVSKLPKPPDAASTVLGKFKPPKVTPLTTVPAGMKPAVNFDTAQAG